jgi:Zn-finger nucleic acid-binding protein
MLCANCNVNIPPEWKAAVRLNSCPSCGNAIMNDAMQTLLEEIRDALKQMPNDPEGLAGWLLSNYQLVKIGDGKPVLEFYGEKRNRNPKQEKYKKDSENLLEQFEKKAGLKASKYKDIISQFESEDNIDDSDEDIEGLDEAEDPEFTKAVLAASVENGMIPRSALPESYQGNDFDDEFGGTFIDPTDMSKEAQAARKMREFLERGKMTRDKQPGTEVGRVSRA